MLVDVLRFAFRTRVRLPPSPPIRPTQGKPKRSRIKRDFFVGSDYTKVMLETLLNVIFPKRCVGCGRLGRYICSSCQKTVVVRELRCPECDRLAIDGATHPHCRRAYGLDGLVTVFVNRGVIKKAIKQLKYRLVADLAESLIDLIPPTTLQNIMLISDEWVLYPVPLHRDRLRWRGFNQAEVLGAFLSSKLQIPLTRGLLVRVAKRTPQADIEKRDDRIKNAKGLFQISSKLQPSTPQSVLLFDDVWTTGATMKEAATVLKRNKVKEVWGMTLAR